MKYTIEGLRQDVMVELGLDAVDAVIVRWFADFIHSGSMREHRKDDKSYWWLSYQHVADELPIIGIDNARTIGRRFRKYVDCGLLARHAIKAGGTQTFFHLEADMWNRLNGLKSTVRADLKVPSEGTPKSALIPLSDSSISDSLSSRPAQTKLDAILGTGLVRKITDYYQSLFEEEYPGFKPTWDGKIIKLVKGDLGRMGDEHLGRLIQLFFEDPGPFVKTNGTGMGYNIFHSQIDRLIEKQARAEKRGA